MSLHVVMEQPRGRPFGRVRHGIAALLGLALILVGFATLPGLVVLVALTHHDRGRADSSTVGHGTVVAFVAVVAALVIVAPLVGLRLVRGSRRLVLFLRRFGYADATQALTVAALTTMGRSWRLVTLDDAAIAPVGVSGGSAKLFAAGEFGGRWLGRIWKTAGSLAMSALALGIAGMVCVAAYVFLRHHSLAPLGDGLRAHHATHADAPGIFIVSVWVAVVGVAAVLIGGLAPLLLVPLLVPWIFLGMSHSALRDAEQAKVTRIVSIESAHSIARAVRRHARRIFSPRLMVLSVNNDVWRPTVKSFAAIASVVLIDVSVLTENLLWEIAEVVRDSSTACVLVGHAEGLRALEVIDTPLERRLAELLDGRTILAYETTEPGMKRFARALRAALEVAV
jgi:hypothetical protein